MGEKISRSVAVIFAVLLVLAYFFLPAISYENYSNYSGRKKLSLEEGETYSWTWTPEKENTNAIELRLSGMKKAQDVTLYAEILGKTGAAIAKTQVQIADLGEAGDSLRLEGSFSPEEVYTLQVQVTGEGQLKLKGEENVETEAFFPLLNEYSESITHNSMLLFFAIGALLAAMTPIFGKRENGIRRPREETKLSALLPGATFFLIASLGLFITILKPMFVTGEVWNSWDEEVHWNHIVTMDLQNPFGLRGLAANLTSANPGYLPLAVGYNLGRIFTSDEITLYHLSVGTSAIFYAFICAMAVKHTPRYKATFLVAATLPTFMFLMTSATYDTVTAGCILLGTAMILEILDQEKEITSLQAITLISLLAFGTVAKELYSPLLLFLLLIPQNRFHGKKEAWMFRGFVMLIFIWCVCAVLVPGTNETVWVGDDRFDDASTPGQVAFILSNPVEGILRPLRWMWNNQVMLTKGGMAHWAYLGNNERANDIYLWLLLILAPLCSVGENFNVKSPLSPLRRAGFGIIAAGSDALFVFALYITSTPVGSENVVGMQARYFMPVWILMALALMWPQKIRKRMGKIGEWLIIPIWLICFGTNLWIALGQMIATGRI